VCVCVCVHGERKKVPNAWSNDAEQNTTMINAKTLVLRQSNTTMSN
jgi:hypothetical protein